MKYTIDLKISTLRTPFYDVNIMIIIIIIFTIKSPVNYYDYNPLSFSTLCPRQLTNQLFSKKQLIKNAKSR